MWCAHSPSITGKGKQKDPNAVKYGGYKGYRLAHPLRLGKQYISTSSTGKKNVLMTSLSNVNTYLVFWDNGTFSPPYNPIFLSLIRHLLWADIHVSGNFFFFGGVGVLITNDLCAIYRTTSLTIYFTNLSTYGWTFICILSSPLLLAYFQVWHAHFWRPTPFYQWLASN